jgi:hypothetical protein
MMMPMHGVMGELFRWRDRRRKKRRLGNKKKESKEGKHELGDSS